MEIQKLESKLNLLGKMVKGKNTFGISYSSPDTPRKLKVIREIDGKQQYENRMLYKSVDFYEDFIVCNILKNTEVYVRGRKEDILHTVTSLCAPFIVSIQLDRIILLRSVEEIILMNYLGKTFNLNHLIKEITTKKLRYITLKPFKNNTVQVFGYNPASKNNTLYHTLDAETLERKIYTTDT